jgi:DNA-binding transcriptional LysR family regulator
MLPTPRARALAQPVAAVLDLLRRDILAGDAFDPATARREFRLCLTDVGSLVFLPRLLHALGREAPDCTLRIRNPPADQLAGMLESGEIDLAIGYYPDLPGSLVQRRLYERDYVCVFRADHPRIGRTLSVRQYVALDHAVVHTPVRVHESVDRALARRRLTRRVALSVPHFIVIPPILESTDLVATLPAEIAAVFSRFVRLRTLPSPVKIPPVVLRLYWHRRFQHDAAHRWLRGVAEALFAE